MEQLRHRLTDVGPKGQRRSVDQNTLKRTDRDDFVSCYFGRTGGTSAVSSKAGTEASPPNRFERKETERFNPDKSGANRFERKESERFRGFTYEELIKRDKINLDIFWLKDEALEDSANLPAPAVTQPTGRGRAFQSSPRRLLRICKRRLNSSPRLRPT